MMVRLLYIVKSELMLIYHSGSENPIVDDHLCQLDFSHFYLDEGSGREWLYTRNFEKTIEQLRNGNSINLLNIFGATPGPL